MAAISDSTVLHKSYEKKKKTNYNRNSKLKACKIADLETWISNFVQSEGTNQPKEINREKKTKENFVYLYTSWERGKMDAAFNSRPASPFPWWINFWKKFNCEQGNPRISGGSTLASNSTAERRGSNVCMSIYSHARVFMPRVSVARWYHWRNWSDLDNKKKNLKPGHNTWTSRK